ncbi:MAG: homocysteine S-methyltransferase family protein [Lachnospiraceae bacterium]
MEPIPSDEVISREELEEQYYQIARVMLEQGLKILTFETFHELQYILPAIGRIKTEAPDTFIMVEFTVNQFGYSSAGLGVKSLLRDASACKDIDAVGLNCGIANRPTWKNCLTRRG